MKNPLNWLDLVGIQGVTSKGCVLPLDVDRGLIREIYGDDYKVFIVENLNHCVVYLESESSEPDPDDTGFQVADKIAKKFQKNYNKQSVRLSNGSVVMPGKAA